MKEQIISRKKQRQLRKLSSVIQMVVVMVFILIGCSNLDEFDFPELAIVLGVIMIVAVILIYIAFFFNDVRRWYRIVVPTYGVIQAFKYNKFHSKNHAAIVCGRLMKKNRYSYSDLFYHIVDNMDEAYGEPDNSTI